MTAADHQMGYRSTSEEVWKKNPVCTEDGHAWPCDVAALRAEVVAALIAVREQAEGYDSSIVASGAVIGVQRVADRLGMDLDAELAKETK